MWNKKNKYICIHFIESKQEPEMFAVIKELEVQMNYPEN